MKDNWFVSEIDEVALNFLDFRGKTPLKLGMNWGDGSIRALSANNVEMGKINFDKECYFGSEKLYQKWMNKGDCEKGDIILTMEAPLGNVAQIPDNNKYILSQRTILIKVNKKKVNNDFIYHLFSGDKFQRELILNSSGSTVTGIQQKKLVKIKIKYPPLPQQQKIAQILTTCDAVIEKTEAAIAKYQAIKQGMMHDLFTRGIDVNTSKLRPSYEEAPHLYKETELGWIPKEWEVKRFEDLCSEKLKYGINAAAVEFNTNLPTYLRITDIDENGNFSKTGRKSVDNPFSDQYYLKKGDIVFARTGATVGKTYLYDENDGALVYAGFLIKASPNKNLLDADFLKFLTETNYYLNWVVLMSQRSGQPGINGAEYGSLKIPTPDIKEQRIISEKLLGALKKVQTEQSALSKYQQLKSGLMQDLLSGKVEVKV